MPIPAETQKLLRLLTQVILADGHIQETEIEALVKGVKDLNLKDQSGEVLTSIKTRNWFEGYKQELNRTWSTVPKSVDLTHLILSLSNWPRKQDVIDVLEDISLADKELHKTEETLISIVKTYWQFDGLDAPNAKIKV